MAPRGKPAAADGPIRRFAAFAEANPQAAAKIMDRIEASRIGSCVIRLPPFDAARALPPCWTIPKT
ncbi:hypothetical protein [Zavarzinia aquatilis]|uniref:Uncharacterized protein n=1 Tax=Zavarzinia aquatilis TaxID=2211142 RepID=A0A317EDG0_9PROT|nr:hypothetical protein [Zavarzinia aquatilis]PWR24959.1 hypothetical protein DKG74_04105 [Zavarzinia aquatilis]